MRSILSIMLGVLVSGSALAQNANVAAGFADPGKAAALPSSGVSSMGQVTLALLIVLAVLFVAAWGMRRFKLFSRNGQTVMEVVQGINLGPKERAVLITVQGRRLLLGVAPGCVNLLLELPAESTAESDTAASAEATASGAGAGASPLNINTPDFKTLLKRSMGLS